MPHYLGLDSSTQSLSAIIIDTDAKRVALSLNVNFGKDLPDFLSPHGFLRNDNPLIVHADPLLWVAALELLLERIRATGYDLSQLRGIGGAGQQHGSVYLNKKLSEHGRFAFDKPLALQVAPLLSRKTSPIWMDSSTTRECEEIAAAVGGKLKVTELTGSRPTERFTGPQIRAFFKREPEAYERTAEIHLVSSFMASLLTGTSAPIDFGDGAGMNLLDLAQNDFSQPLLDATAPGLREKLPGLCQARSVVGTVASYFVEKYGIRAGTPVTAFTGDNPSSLVGMGATKPGVAVISLGTSDTVFAAMSKPLTDPNGFGHVFGNPAAGFMSLICFTNGSLAREAVAKEFGMGWEEFSDSILERTEPGNGDNWMLPFFAPESTPRVLKPNAQRFGSPDFVAGKIPARVARAIVEIQAVSMRLHSRWIGETPSTIRITGGAAKSPAIRQILADVFQAVISPLQVDNASALGSALLAANTIGELPFEQLFADFVHTEASTKATPMAPADTYDRLEQKLKAKLQELAR